MKQALILLSLLGLLLTPFAANGEVLWSHTVTGHIEYTYFEGSIYPTKMLMINMAEDVPPFLTSWETILISTSARCTATEPSSEIYFFQDASTMMTGQVPWYIDIYDAGIASNSARHFYFDQGFVGYDITAIGFDRAYFNETYLGPGDIQTGWGGSSVYAWDYEYTYYIEGDPHVPEPSSILALLSGIAGTGVAIRRKK